MIKTVAALYQKFKEAEKVMHSLTEAGFDQDKINLITNDEEVMSHFYENIEYENVGDNVSFAAKMGSTLGGAGTLFAVQFIPGLGTVAALGALVVAFGGAAIGGVAGGIVGGLLNLNIPQEQADHYVDGVRLGGTLLTLQTDETRVKEAVAIMRAYDLADVQDLPFNWDHKDNEPNEPKPYPFVYPSV